MTADELLALMREKYAPIPDGLCVRGVWRWTIAYDGENVSIARPIKTLEKRGMIECSYFHGGRAGAHLTAKGRGR
jgi:hypothetical protein